MADDMDEFEQENFDASEPPALKSEGGGLKKSLTEAWRTQPLFKLMVIMLFVGVAIAGALGTFSEAPPVDPSKIVSAPSISEAPGGKASPYFIDQNKQANAERADQAMQQGGSAMPTPVGQNIDLGDLESKKKEDPLAEFRAETERLKQEMNAERQQNAQQMQVLQQQAQQQQPPEEKEDDTLAQAMQKQMQQLMDAWAPHNIKVVAGTEPKESAAEKQRSAEVQTQLTGAQMSQMSQVAQGKEKTIVQAGSVNYAQMLTEANSDVPGPILAQVLSGPFTGGRAIGSFKTMADFLIIEFSLINFKGKDYPVNILALDPNTTLGALVTDVDHRYFDRVILPAAAAFAGQFGSTLGQGGSTTTVTDNAVLVDQASKSYKEALYSGLGQAGASVSQFLQQEASQIKPLVRVATGTPMGLFFLTSVKETGDGMPVQPTQQELAGLYQTGGLAAIPGYAGANQAANPYLSAYKAAYPGTTGYGAYNPYATGATAYGMQQIPGTSIMMMPTGQTGLGTTVINR